jgi:hypothetical protein
MTQVLDRRGGTGPCRLARVRHLVVQLADYGLHRHAFTGVFGEHQPVKTCLLD